MSQDVSLENYRWGDKLRAEDRARLLKEVRESPDGDPDLPDTVSDSGLYLKWLRS